MDVVRRPVNRRVLGKLLLLFLPLMLLLLQSSLSSAALDTLKFPFGAGSTWKVQQGYNNPPPGTHDDYQRYSFDLVRDDGATSGQPVYAPAPGYVAWGGTSLDTRGCISIKMPPDYQYRVMLCHIIFDHNFDCDPGHNSDGEYVYQGQQLGTVAPAWDKGNNGIPHIHITLYHLPSGQDDKWSNRTGIPFDDAHDWPLDRVNFAVDDNISNQYEDVYGLCSSQNINPSVKVNWIVTTDGNDYPKYTFRRGDFIHYWVNVTNSNSSAVSPYYDWRAFGPSSTTIFSWSGNLEDSSGAHWWYAPWPTVPPSVPEGYYTFRVEATYDGVQSCRANVFRVHGDILPVDVYLIVDLTGSFLDDLPVFKTQAPAIISTLQASIPDIRFGLGKFEDYPIYPFGSAFWGDKAYERLVGLTFDTDLVLNTIEGLPIPSIFDGGDFPESQLPALFQAATGAGQDLSGVGYPGASILSGQQANFRTEATKLFLLWTDAPFHQPGDPGDIPYPGPSFGETASAIRALAGSKVIGIFSPGGLTGFSNNQEVLESLSVSDGRSDLERIAAATGSLAPADGVDCDGDGTIDLAPGQPLVCGIGYSGEGIAEAIIALVEAAAKPSVFPIHLPIIMKNYTPGSQPSPPVNIYGNVTDNGIPAAGIELLLRYYDGSTWSTYDSTTTDSSGNYQFTNLPSLGTDQRLYVSWSNTDYNSDRLFSWACWYISSSTADPDAYRCNFDLDNIDLLSPSPSATVSLPYTFTWRKRPVTTDDYELNLADMSDRNPWWWTYPSLGYVDGYTLNGLPEGFVPGQRYGWWMWVYGPDGYGISYYYYNVTFSNAGSSEVQTVPMSSHISKENIEVIAPPQSR